MPIKIIVGICRKLGEPQCESLSASCSAEVDLPNTSLEDREFQRKIAGHKQPPAVWTERFISMLQLAKEEDFCEKPRLIDLQNRIVDPRFKAAGYRDNQNYVGETAAWKNERVHYVCPRPEDIHDLMEGLIASHQRLEESSASPVVHAASIAYGFVFLHPFEDGNGRLHRFLIHNILARREFTPEGIMFPVSAAMLNNAAEYDASLEEY